MTQSCLRNSRNSTAVNVGRGVGKGTSVGDGVVVGAEAEQAPTTAVTRSTAKAMPNTLGESTNGGGILFHLSLFMADS